MAFNAGTARKEKKIVLAIEVPREDGGNEAYRYLVTQLKRSEIIQAAAEDRLKDDDNSSAVLLSKIMNNSEPLDEGTPPLSELADRFESDVYQDFVRYVIRIATADPVTLANEGIEVR